MMQVFTLCPSIANHLDMNAFVRHSVARLRRSLEQ
jgi:hypothetical protein